MSVNYNVVGGDGASTEVEYTGGGLTLAVPGEPNGPPDGWDEGDDRDDIDWFGLLLYEEEYEDPESRVNSLACVRTQIRRPFFERARSKAHFPRSHA